MATLVLVYRLSQSHQSTTAEVHGGPSLVARMGAVQTWRGSGYLRSRAVRGPETVRQG